MVSFFDLSVTSRPDPRNLGHYKHYFGVQPKWNL